MDDTILEVREADKNFGGVSVLEKVSFTLPRRRIKGLIGPNGAGKTTLFNVITGMYPNETNDVRLNIEGQSIRLSRMKPYRIARTGVGRTFQKPSIAWHLTVFENVLLGAMNHRREKILLNRQRLKEWTEYCLETVQIPVELWHQAVAKVTIDTIKKIEFARAIALSPYLVLFDEICSGLSHAETDDLIELIHVYNQKEKASILFVEHDLRAVKKVCSEVVVIDFGQVIFDGSIEDAFTDEKVIQAYIGEENA